MAVAIMACTINIITVVIEDSKGINYDHKSITRMTPHFGVSLLEVSFTSVGYKQGAHYSPHARFKTRNLYNIGL